MREQILAKLKAKYSGLPTQLLGLIADKLAAKVTEESQIEGALSELDNSPIPVKDYADFLQKEGDRRVTKALADAKPPKTDEPPKQDKDDPNAAILQQLQALAEKVTSFEKKEQQSKLSQTLAAKLAEKKIPAAFLKGRTVESEEQLDAVLSEVEADFTAVKQELVNQGFSQTSAPVGGSTTLKTDNVEADILAHFGKDKQ